MHSNTKTLGAADWAGARGARWRQNLQGLEAMLQGLEAPLIEALRLEGAGQIADLACGGGATTLALHARRPPGARVTGYDISPDLIALARERAAASGPRFEMADLSTAPAPKPPCDRLVSRFGMMFFPDPAAAFAKLRGWLIPGGRFVFAVWGPPADNPWARLVREAVGGAIALPEAAPDAPGPFRYGEVGTLLALLSDAGFRQLAVQDWRQLLPVGGGLPAAQAARFALNSFSVAEPLFSAGPAALEQAWQTLTDAYSAHETDGIVRLMGRVHLVSGTA